MGANEHGLAIGNQAIFATSPASDRDGIIGMDFVRLALERAANIDEAVAVITDLLREHGQAGQCGFDQKLAYHNSYLLADPTGALVLETVDREWAVRRINAHSAISNALTIERDVAGRDFRSIHQDPAHTASGDCRRARAEVLLAAEAGSLDAASMFAILRDHGEHVPGERKGPTICAHKRSTWLGQTTASWVSSIRPGKTVHWVTATSAPCTALFKPVVLESGLPVHGPTPGRVEDYASLWWRHEQLRAALESAPSGVLNAYTQDLAALELAFVREIEDLPPICDERGIERARVVTASCWKRALQFEHLWYARLIPQRS